MLASTTEDTLLHSFVIFRLSLSTSSSSCQELQDTALNVLLAGVPSHVATFGNSDVNKPGDWVKIINNKPTQTVSTTAKNHFCAVTGMYVGRI